MALRVPMILLLGLCASWMPALADEEPIDEQVAGSLMRYFTDSDHVAVRSLIQDYAMPLRKDLGFKLHWNNERVAIPGIKAPVGSAEAVDAITTASRPISGNAYRDFIKVRNELQGELTRGRAAVDYYYSTESDYLGQQLGMHYDRDFQNRELNLAFGSSYGWDAIKPLADDDTRTAGASKNTLHWNAVATRILSPTTVVRIGLEYNIVDGLQHNPYRNVYAGGTNVPERHPDHRQRSDAFVRLSQYLRNRSSVKLGYRYYSDDWGISSHEASAKLSQYVTQGVFARYEYRYYTQTSASFYRDDYAATSGVGGYLSGDYRVAPLTSHLFGLSLNFDLGTLAVESALLRRLVLWGSYERYFNRNNYSANILESGLDYRF